MTDPLSLLLAHPAFERLLVDELRALLAITKLSGAAGVAPARMDELAALAKLGCEELRSAVVRLAGTGIVRPLGDPENPTCLQVVQIAEDVRRRLVRVTLATYLRGRLRCQDAAGTPEERDLAVLAGLTGYTEAESSATLRELVALGDVELARTDFGPGFEPVAVLHVRNSFARSPAAGLTDLELEIAGKVDAWCEGVLLTEDDGAPVAESLAMLCQRSNRSAGAILATLLLLEESGHLIRTRMPALDGIEPVGALVCPWVLRGSNGPPSIEAC